MLVLEFFTWWYGAGWLLLTRNMRRRLLRTSHVFSLPILLRTLFAPWRRIMTYPGASLADHARAMGDNAVSRAVGFVVRIGVLLAAAVILVIVSLLAVIELLVWPLLPVAVLVTIVKGITG